MMAYICITSKEERIHHHAQLQNIFFFSVMFVFPLCINYRVPMIWIFGYLQAYRLLLTPSQVFMHQGLS